MSILGWIISALAMYANSQSYQRFGSSKSGGDIKVSYTCIMIFGLFFSSIMVIAGMAALILFPEAAAEAPSEAFWATVFTTLPVGLRGLFVAALLSAVMSTVSADYLICGAVIVHDIIKSFFKPSLSDKGEVWGTRIVIWIVGLLIIICTYFWEDGISKAYYYCGGFQVAAFIVPLMLGLFYKKKTPAPDSGACCSPLWLTPYGNSFWELLGAYLPMWPASYSASSYMSLLQAYL